MNEFCKEQKISPLNTRLVKHEDGSLELKIASMKHNAMITPYLQEFKFKGKEIDVTAGDYSAFLNGVFDNLSLA